MPRSIPVASASFVPAAMFCALLAINVAACRKDMGVLTIAKRIVSICGEGRFAFQNLPFERPKRVVSHCKTGCFAMQNGTFRNALTTKWLCESPLAAGFLRYLTFCGLAQPRHVFAEEDRLPQWNAKAVAALNQPNYSVSPN